MLLRRDLGISNPQREDAFSFYPYCFYDRDNGRVDLYLLLYWSNPVSQVLRAMAFKRTTRGRSNFGELMTAKIS
jgi:hypothetical protein